jgi:3',5'-cyclic AMP phosphodiesterase CpdA
MTRVLHFSDVHVNVPPAAFVVRGMWGKRTLGFANLMLRRRRRSHGARAKLERLGELARRLEVDLVICTGDYTALGTDAELAAARQAISGLTSAPLGFVTVPGNHDVYMPDGVRERRFERHFGEFLITDMPERRTNTGWPLVRLFGEGLAVVAVNSARPNPQLWRSSGHVPPEELDALAAILDDARLRERFVFVITHYAPRLEDGSPDTITHGMTNAEELLRACERVGRGALLHGHVHWCYHVAGEGLPLFGAGSATHRGREGFWLFDVGAEGGTATPGRWQGGEYVLDEHRAVRV